MTKRLKARRGWALYEGDEVVSIIMKWVKDSEIARLTLLAEMAHAVINKGKID